MSGSYGRTVGVRLLAVLTIASGGLAFWMVDTQMKKGGDSLGRALVQYSPMIALFLGFVVGSVMLLARHKDRGEIRLYFLFILAFVAFWVLLVQLGRFEVIQIALAGVLVASLFIPLGRGATADPWPDGSSPPEPEGSPPTS